MEIQKYVCIICWVEDKVREKKFISGTLMVSYWKSYMKGEQFLSKHYTFIRAWLERKMNVFGSKGFVDLLL